MYATISESYRPLVTKNTSSKVIQSLIVWNNLVGVIVQNITSSTEEWFGLSKEDAESLCIANTSSVLNGVERSYLGTAKLSQVVQPGQVGGAYVRATNCWGTEINSAMNRMNDTNLYHVTRTTTVYSVSAGGNSVSLTLE